MFQYKKGIFQFILKDPFFILAESDIFEFNQRKVSVQYWSMNSNFKLFPIGIIYKFNVRVGL